LERRKNLDTQEGWRYAPAQGGRHVVCKARPAHEEVDDKADNKKEVMHVYDSHMTCEECRDTGHSGNHCPEMFEDVNNYYYYYYYNRP